MIIINKIVLVGRLTKDPELNFLPGKGTPVTKFTLAVNRPQFDKSKPQEADFINCVCFGKRAEAIASYVQKGHKFGVSGRLQINKYVDKEGQNRWSTDVLVDDFEFLQDKRESKPTSEAPTKEYEEVPVVDDTDIPF